MIHILNTSFISMNPFNKGVALDAIDAIDDTIEKVESFYDRVIKIKEENDYPTCVTNRYLQCFRRQIEQLNNLKIYVSSVVSETTVNLTQDQFTLIQNFYQK